MKTVDDPVLAHSSHPAVQIENSKAITTSPEIARVFDKRHDHVLDAIRLLLANLSEDHLMVLSPADLGITLSQMLTITHVCFNNMRTSAGMYASQLNIQPAKSAPSPRGQFSSMGIPSLHLHRLDGA